MKRIYTLLLVALLGVGVAGAQVADSIDVLDYDISLDLSAGAPFAGDALLTVRLVRQCGSFALGLYGVPDTVWVNNAVAEQPNLSAIDVSALSAGDTFTVRVKYQGQGFVEGYGWGGFHFDNNMTYNLGVGFNTNPHPVGRAVFPCRDNFTDKATYTLRITTRPGYTAECSGNLDERTPLNGGAEYSVWRIDQPVPTYIVGVSQAAFKRIDYTVANYPVTIGYTTAQDSATVRRVFALLDSVVPMYERCFGPYRWHRIGYIPTARGSMEHVNNIALAYQAMQGISDMGQSTIAHELGHAWFGNLITCYDEGDMWINEGGASFCSEVAREATHGRGSATAQYQQNLEAVVRQTHITDGQVLSLHDMPHANTYGSTTYDKGALVWHSLRGVMGDTLFYSAMRRLFASCAFGNITAAALRDSLEAYSGVDLHDFFDFHVFGKGFVDWNATFSTANCPPGYANITVRQQGVYTDQVPHTSLVPVTVCGWAGERHKVWLRVEGQISTTCVELPFAPAYCLIDADCEVSDAATVDVVSTARQGNIRSEVTHTMFNVREQNQSAKYTVEHHWGRPYDADTITGVLRTANRYWVVRGSQYQALGVQANFRYVRAANQNSDYANLDRGFLTSISSVDSIGLLWRYDDRSPWHLVTTRHSNNRNEGYLILENMRCGEYTLAIVDTTRIGIADVQQHTHAVNLFPNPVRCGESLVVDAPLQGVFRVVLTDAAGHIVGHNKRMRSGQKLHAPHQPGIYLLRIENNSVSLQAKLLVI